MAPLSPQVAALALTDARGEIALLRQRIEHLEEDHEMDQGLIQTWTLATSLAQAQVFTLSQSLRRIHEAQRSFRTRNSSTTPRPLDNGEKIARLTPG